MIMNTNDYQLGSKNFVVILLIAIFLVTCEKEQYKLKWAILYHVTQVSTYFWGPVLQNGPFSKSSSSILNISVNIMFI